MVTASICPACNGSGEEIASSCPDCRGEGRKIEEKSYLVDVPAGVDDGTTLRLTARGAAGPRRGPPGDLYVHLRVKRHDRFERHGNDLLHVLELPVTQAALGAELAFETLDGEEQLVVPAGTQTGREFRLRGRGVPHVNGRGRGDLVVRMRVETPTELSPEQEELLRQLAEQRGEAVAAGSTGLLSKIRSAFK
jgi:molecular chaperone DnaJ